MTPAGTDPALRLAKARADARVLEPEAWPRITSVDEAYAVQSELLRREGRPAFGWKVSALTPADQAKFGTDRPVAGVLLSEYCRPSPAALQVSSFIAPLIECEIAFVLGSAIPARETAYRLEEIEDAIEAVVPVIELADCRFPADAPNLLKLADMMGNGAFVTGTPVRAWRDLDLSSIPITLSVDGDHLLDGTSARILGNPLLAVLALANAQPLPAPGLQAGQIVTTGTCTNPLAPRAGRYVGSFGTLGEVEIRFAP